MRNVEFSLSRQLLSVGVLLCGIIFISLGFLLPRALLPLYERSIYQYLRQPLELLGYDFNDNEIATDVAYLYITTDNEIVVSDNLNDVIKATPKQVLDYIDKNDSDYGKFTYIGRTYYYNSVSNKYVTKIALTSDAYIDSSKKDLIYTMFPVLLITLLLMAALIILWSRRLIRRIENLKDKVDNLDNDYYVEPNHYHIDDELQALSKAIDDMKVTLKEQDEYKNQMYQNISHDFKTPLTVIKSYIEAIEDGVQDEQTGYQIIKEQVNKLEIKVHSLLYLNKLTYMKDFNDYKDKTVDIAPILQKSIEKFKVQRPEIKWNIYIGDKSTVFKGTNDMWEAIIDNMFNNFMRYADKTIKVSIKNHHITFYNDGPAIAPDILDDIFTPYTKGIKGQFGLGLSIIKKTLLMVGYEVSVKNEKTGVSFIIK